MSEILARKLAIETTNKIKEYNKIYFDPPNKSLRSRYDNLLSCVTASSKLSKIDR
ncbi:hypothetical protein ALC56_05765 [Trachymyrmex septentrionalis]|uniref:Uncharacterized protein n=1 Tax=Trachymyrmex septentrionalis TaxID=34720 RepID=A0A151JY05_9HYME|nr:hypothetical protein ALC56_05765 [Trachymyrmex septentrionalis]